VASGLRDRLLAPKNPPRPEREVGVPPVVLRAEALLFRLRERARPTFRRFVRPGRDELREPYVRGETRVAGALLRPAMLGFLASISILVGASQASSPFTLHRVNGVPAWYFGLGPAVPPPVQQPAGIALFLGIIAVFGGIALMLRAWYEVVRVTSRHPGIPLKMLVPIFVAWVLPLLIVAPLFSKDAYSYAAQGEMMSRHINPYSFGPGLVGQGNQFGSLADKLWWNVSSPYGPVFLVPAGWLVSLSGHNALLSVELLRLLALFGTVLFAAAVPVIARSFGRDGSTAFALAALNPLVLLHLIGGVHNDALMVGLAVVGYALARRGRPVLGIVMCALAALVKVPALLVAVYIGWEWLGSGRSLRERVRPVATALLIAASVMAAISELAGIGWGWISGLSNPDAVRSYLDPATGLALLAARFLQAIGLPSNAHLLITLARGSGLLLAAVIALYLLVRSERLGSLQAIGWSFLALVLLSPVVQPWYLAWGFVFLAPVAEGLVRRVLIIASGVACYVQLPGGRSLLGEIASANPWFVALACVMLVGIASVVLLPRIRRRGTGRSADAVRVAAGGGASA